jgi:OOP family OmpA-OmpF porin
MKALFRYWTSAIVMIIAMAVLWGCGGTPLMIEPIDPRQDPKDLIEQLNRQIDQARDNQVDVLSPTWFEKAGATCAAARQKIKNNASADDVRRQIAIAHAELQQAEVTAAQSRDQLAETIAARDAARAVDAQQFGQAYGEVESAFLGLTRAIEDNEFDYARQRRHKVAERYRALELRAIDLAALGDVRVLMQNARNAKVQKIAPKTLLEAQNALREAETYIAANRYDKAGIKAKAERARFLTQRSMVIAEAGRRLEAMRPEDIALWVETFMFQATTRLQTQDRRNLPFEQQQGAILTAVDDLRAELTMTKKSVEDKTLLIEKMGYRLAEFEEKTQAIRLGQQQLVAQKRFDESVIKVQRDFDPREADVRIQNDRMIIRLKGIRFPAGGAHVSPGDYGLLMKVQRAILTFGLPEVVIEGHTDNTGTPEMNLALSRERAESVRRFLLDRHTLPRDKISAVGYGAGHPVAPNNTAEGRSRNRRIDVIIKPDKSAIPASQASPAVSSRGRPSIP